MFDSHVYRLARLRFEAASSQAVVADIGLLVKQTRKVAASCSIIVCWQIRTKSMSECTMVLLRPCISEFT